MTDRKVVQCNLTETTNIAPAGARAYVVLTNPGGGHDRIQVLVRSHGGRWVEKWENMRRLADFRVKTLPPEHPLYANERIWDYDPDGTAATLNEAKRRHSAAPGASADRMEEGT